MTQSATLDASQLAGLSREEKLALLARLSREKQAAVARPDFSGGQGSYPLTFAQKRLLFLHHLEGGTNVHTQFRALWLSGPLDRAALDAAFVELVRRHEALRTRFVSGGAAGDAEAGMESARQIVGPVPTTVVEVNDLTELPVEQRRPAAEALAGDKAREPFDLENGPVLRVNLAVCSDQEHALIVGLHHIISDGLSRGLLLSELAVLYSAFTAGKASPLPEPRAQLGAFASWQRERMSGERLTAELEFWVGRLEGAPSRLELPADRPRRGLVTPEGGIEMFELPAAVADGLRELARLSGATPFMVMLALYDTLLMRYSGKRDLVVGLPVAARDHTELETAIGCFANTFVQRIRLAPGGSFRDLLAAVKAEIASVLPHAEVPFEKVVEAVAPERDFAQNPIFQVMFALQVVGEGRFEMAGLEVASLLVERAMANVDLTMELVDAGGHGAMRGFLDYAVDLFDRATIRRMAGHLGRLAASIVADPDRPLFQLAMLADGERDELLRGWAPPARSPTPQPVHQRFAEIARQAPDSLALVDGERHLTYGEIDRRANRLARLLRSRIHQAGGAVVDVPIGVCFERSAELMICVLAVLKAGAAYLPLDPAYPRKRLALMIEDAQAPLVLADAASARRLPKPRAGAGGAKLLFLDRGPYGILGELEKLSDEPLTPLAEFDHLAYLIYTSGSTGTPKAVAVTHRGVTNHASALAERLRHAPGKRFLYSASISFDVAAEEIYPVWVSGATLVILEPGPFPSFADLLALIEERRLTGVDLPTPYWHEWVAALARTGGQPPSCLDLVLVGTEQASAERLVQWLRLVGERPRWVNAYGPTEATISASTFIPTVADAEGMTRVPIGKPIEGVRAFILDEYFEPTPMGVPGKLYLAGPGVTRGYLRRPALTAAAFIPHVFAQEPGARLYATGDLARYRPGGDIEFLGRGDEQVKIRGFRIELGEITEALRAHPQVTNCAVLVQEDVGGPRLVAYVVAAPGTPVAANELSDFLGTLLPAYMVPSIVPMSDLPLTTAGKIDRKKLAAQAIEPQHSEQSQVAPSGPLEEAVAAIWCDVLGVGQVSAQEDFFEVGGHSLLATRVIARLREQLGVDLSLPAFFEARTVAALALAVGKQRQLVAAGSAGIAAPPPIVPIAREGGVICSFAQQRQWFLNQLLPENPANHIPQLLRLRGALSVAALERAIDGLVRRHETLRTTFALRETGPNAGQPVQRIAVPAPLPTLVREARLPRIDLSALGPRQGAAAVQELAMRLASIESLRPFDLAAGPLLRAYLLRLAPEDHLFYFCTHHIVSDGVSIGLTVQDLVALYEGEARGVKALLPELPIQYADFAAWQRGWLTGEALEAQLSFWHQTLDGAPTAIELPLDRPRPPVEEARGRRHYFRIGAEQTAALAALGRQRGATMFMALAALFNVLLSRWSGQLDVLVGWPIGGRNRAELERIIGFLANILVLRTDLSGAPGFSGVLDRVRSAALGAYDHQELPFQQLVKELRPERDLARHPIFQTFFVLHHPAGGSVRVEGVEVSVPSLDNGTSRLDLLLSLMHLPGGLTGFFEYNSDLFDATTIDRLSRQFQALLAAAVAEPTRPVARLDWLDSASRHQLLQGWNDSARAVPGGSIHTLVAARAAAVPERQAVEFAGETLTYAELDGQADRLAHHLLSLGVEPDAPVAVALERSLELVVSMLAVLKAGAAYLPLDPALPPARLEYVLGDAAAAVVVTDPALRHLFYEAEAAALAAGAPLAVVEIEPGLEGLPEPRPGAQLPAVSPAQLAYVIYTSGSTGKPKGVAVPHTTVANFLAAMAAEPGLTADDSLLAVTTVAFDIHALEIWLPLTVGARVVVADADTAADGQLLRRAIEDSGVTVLQATPATWRGLVEVGWTGQPTLRALCGGEALPPALAREISARVASLVNVYGPTETTVWSSLEHLPRLAGAESVETAVAGPVAIGRPIANTELHVVDEALGLAAIGVAGELWIGGSGVVRGYHGRPALTADRFVPDPFGARPGVRLYRTGDVCRRLADGRALFVRRADNQVKVRGFRIELGEVEAALERQPAVSAAVAAVHSEAGSDDARLVAYFVPADKADGGQTRSGVLRAALREELPEYMIPSLFVSLPELPRTASGKVDRKNLPAPEVARSALGVEFEPPCGEVEEAVAEMWKEVLHLEQVGRHDRFFELGGHSLMAMQILTRITRRFGVELPLRAVFENLTVAALSELIVTTELGATDEALLAALMDGLDELEEPGDAAAKPPGEVAELVSDRSHKGESDG